MPAVKVSFTTWIAVVTINWRAKAKFLFYFKHCIYTYMFVFSHPFFIFLKISPPSLPFTKGGGRVGEEIMRSLCLRFNKQSTSKRNYETTLSFSSPTLLISVKTRLQSSFTLKQFRWKTDFSTILYSFCVCVKREKLCNCHSVFFLLFFLLVTFSGQTGKSYFQSLVQLLLWAPVTRIGVNNIICRVLSTHAL